MKRNASLLESRPKNDMKDPPTHIWKNTLTCGSLNSEIFQNNPFCSTDFKRSSRDNEEVMTVKGVYREMMNLRIYPLGEINPAARIVRLDDGPADWDHQTMAEIEEKAMNRRIVFMELLVARPLSLR